jgi:Predicted amidophosphoribosyltransferases
MPINRERIVDMITWKPRRYRLADFERPLKAPGELKPNSQDWNLSFPFAETFVPAFEMVCKVDHISFRPSFQTGSRHYTFLKNVSDEKIEEIKKWLSIISPYVALRDCLGLSFALDYDKDDGDPNKPQTQIGSLRSRAKPYNAEATLETFSAADELAQACLDFLQKVQCYNCVDTIVAMPPSKPNKRFDLPTYLAIKIAKKWGKTNLSNAVWTVRERLPIKNLALEDKLQALENTIQVAPDVFKGKTVLIVDDLYQSGISINYVALLLLEAGAENVVGLACEKTCRNDDNIRGRDGR